MPKETFSRRIKEHYREQNCIHLDGYLRNKFPNQDQIIKSNDIHQQPKRQHGVQGTLKETPRMCSRFGSAADGIQCTAQVQRFLNFSGT